MPSLKFKSRLAYASLFLLPSAFAQGSLRCISSGVDFRDSGLYFQNSLSNSPFTFVGEFEGCQNVTAENVLIDPTGKEYICSDTLMQPDNTPELSTCPIQKKDMISGPHAIVIISNNGDAEPIAYQREFDLTVGPQATTTYTPTVILPTTITPIFNITSVSTYSSTTVLPPVTITKPSVTVYPTVTSTPKAVTNTKTITLLTLTITRPTLSIKQITNTVTASCITPTKGFSADPTATITPTAITAAALQSPAANAKFRRHQVRQEIENRKQQLKARAERFVGKRAPDFPTITLTETDTAKYVTSTTTFTAPTRTVTVISITTQPVTSTPPAVTAFNGVSSASVQTVTLPTSTKTKTNYVLFGFVTKTATISTTVSIKTTITPTGVAAACTSIGGKLS